MDKKISTPAERQAENKRKAWERRNITADLSRCVLNATITMMVHVLLNATRALGKSEGTCYECGNSRGTKGMIMPEDTRRLLFVDEKTFVFHSEVNANGETEDKSKENQLEDVPTIQDFPKVFPEDLPGLPTTRQVEILDQSGTWCCICSTGALSISTVQNEKVVRATTGTTRQRLYKTQFLTLGSSSHVCQEEGWTISNVHRLSRTEQAVAKRHSLTNSQGFEIFC
ncbi:hypothetical protein Tco_0144977 [Tanacetum coccineum]